MSHTLASEDQPQPGSASAADGAPPETPIQDPAPKGKGKLSKGKGAQGKGKSKDNKNDKNKVKGKGKSKGKDTPKAETKKGVEKRAEDTVVRFTSAMHQARARGIVPLLSFLVHL